MSQVAPYKLPQVVAEIPPPAMDVPLPIRKALLIDSKCKAVSHLIHREYELTNTSWSKLQRKYHISRDKVYTAIKGKEGPEVPSTSKRRKLRSLSNLKLQYLLPLKNL